MVWQLALAVIAAVAFTAYQLVIERQVDQLGGSAREVYRVVLLVATELLALSVIRAVGGVRFANRNFEQPYLTMRATEQQRHRQALQQWEQVVRQHAAEAARAAAAAANGPLWYPVYPASEPTRVDVFGGDPRRHGWASLLVTFGASLLSAGHRITVLDLTGQEVGDNLVSVARAVGMSTRTVRLDAEASADVHLLSGLGPRDIAECLGHALTCRQDSDRREERALAVDTLRRMVASLDAPVTFARLAAGVRVLRRGTGDQLSDSEVDRLAAHIGDVDQTEWTTRQLRLLVSQLDLLHELAPAESGRPLWTGESVTLIATEGGRGDRKELIDRTVVRLAWSAMDGRRVLRGPGRGRCGPPRRGGAADAVRTRPGRQRAAGDDDRPAAGRPGEVGRHWRRRVLHEDVQPPRRRRRRRVHRQGAQVRAQPADPPGRHHLHRRRRGQLRGDHQRRRQLQAAAVRHTRLWPSHHLTNGTSKPLTHLRHPADLTPQAQGRCLRDCEHVQGRRRPCQRKVIGVGATRPQSEQALSSGRAATVTGYGMPGSYIMVTHKRLGC